MQKKPCVAVSSLDEFRQQTQDVARRLGQLLRTYRTGHPEWYAELLVASAFSGVIAPTNNPAFDVTTPEHGRVQVKVRVDGTDTTQNRSNFGRYGVDDFDYAAIVIFHEDYRIKSAVLIPCAAVLTLVRRAGHVKWSDAAGHPQAIDITAELLAISSE